MSEVLDEMEGDILEYRVEWERACSSKIGCWVQVLGCRLGKLGRLADLEFPSGSATITSDYEKYYEYYQTGMLVKPPKCTCPYCTASSDEHEDEDEDEIQNQS